MPPATHAAVSAHRDGYRRAGRAWSRRPETVAIEDLPTGGLAALIADPRIAIEGADGDLPDAGEPQAASLTLEVAQAEILDLRDQLEAVRHDADSWRSRAHQLEMRLGQTELTPPADDEAPAATAAGDLAGGAGDSPAPPVGDPPASREDRIAAAAAAILHRADEEELTAAGKPRVEAVEAEAGLPDVTAAERDAALAAL